MAEIKNYLLGYGERLTEKLEPPKRSVTKKDPYTFDIAKDRLGPRLSATSAAIEALPAGACPNDEAVAEVTLHPTYIAKSYFPSGLLRTVGLEAIGSRAHEIIPEVGAKQKRKAKESKKNADSASALSTT